MYINISPQVGLWIEHRFNLDKKSKKAGKCKGLVRGVQWFETTPHQTIN
jgi:hypothetical protein